ncbi:MAG: hypothetical protein EP330_09480 [Deltaproteobacteria bacterium]|nr:MAG: hypothetical protein EP330_09480 [Deltaproteobacteria bacterium]
MSNRTMLMKMALGYKIATDIVEADENVDPAERAFIMKKFPYAELMEAGFVSPSGEPTPRLQTFLDDALVAFPTEVPLEERLQMLDDFIDAVTADGELNEGEARILRQGATMLGLSEEQIDERMEAHPAVGVVELGDPE